jgi:methylenetetrahydrofolate reductase (NADPH)
MFIGAAANPFADPFELRVARLAKKVAAGADFVQTQCIYNIDKFETWMKGVVDRGLHEKVLRPGRHDPHEIRGHGPLHERTRCREWTCLQELVMERLAGVPKDKQAQEGIDICH